MGNRFPLCSEQSFHSSSNTMKHIFLLLCFTIPIVAQDPVQDALISADTNSTAPVNSDAQPVPPSQMDSVAAKGQIIAHDVTGEVVPMRAISKASAAEPSLGLHGITEQQLNLRYYNFICSSHFHLDCKVRDVSCFQILEA